MARVSIPDIRRMKDEKRKIVMMTAYDFQMAAIIDRAGVEMVLVGDSGERYQSPGRILRDFRSASRRNWFQS